MELAADSREQAGEGEQGKPSVHCSAKMKKWTVAPLPNLLKLAREDGFQLLTYIQWGLQEGTEIKTQTDEQYYHLACLPRNVV